jgi:hypothetical protein
LVYIISIEHFLPERLHTSRPTASRLSSVNLADFLARKDLADFSHEVLLDFLVYGFVHSVNNILSYQTCQFECTISNYLLYLGTNEAFLFMRHQD